MIYSSNTRDDIVRYENAEETSQEEDINYNHTKSYIDFNYESEEESNILSTNKNDTKTQNSKINILKQFDSVNGMYSNYSPNFKHESNDAITKKKINLNNVGTIEIKDYQKIIKFENANPIPSQTTINNNLNTATKQLNVCKETTNNILEFKDILKLNQEKKISVFEKYKIKTEDASNQYTNLVSADNKIITSMTNTTSARDLKKFINIDSSSQVNDCKSEITKEDK